MQLKTPYDFAVKARKMGKKTISYSQSRFEPNMFLVFGTAFHETLQFYLDTMYKETAVAANNIDLNKMLKDNMASEYKKRLDETEGKHFSCQEEMSDFYSDGVAILEWFKKKRANYFSKKKYEFVSEGNLLFHITFF